MFTTERVGCFLNTFGGHGDDNENKELNLVFHVSPITPELASEISPLLADRLFRKNGEGEWEPVAEMSKAAFAGISIPMQDVTFHAFGEEGTVPNDRVLVLGAAISNLRATRMKDSSHFRLEFDTVIPMDTETMRLIERFYKATCFLTMKEIQQKLEFQGVTVSAGEKDAFQAAADGEQQELREALDGKSAGAGDDSPAPPRRSRRKKEAVN